MNHTDLTDDAIVKPVVNDKTPRPGSTAVMLSSDGDARQFLKMTGREPAVVRPLFTSRLHILPCGDDRFAAVGPIVGAPYAVMLLETLIAWGVKRFYYIGWCGAIADTVKIGDVLMPTGAIVDEGTSLHYGGDRGGLVEPPPALGAYIKAALKHRKIDCRQGTVWTTDAIYRETSAKAEYFRRQGALAVEMEMSALFSVARFRQVDIGALLVVSDELASGRWIPGFKNKRFQHNRRSICGIIADLCQKNPILK